MTGYPFTMNAYAVTYRYNFTDTLKLGEAGQFMVKAPDLSAAFESAYQSLVYMKRPHHGGFTILKLEPLRY